jgi:hypothetical protein
MIVGVVGFYFLLSDINSIISNTIKKEIQFSAKLSMLEKVNENYQLTEETYKEAKQSLFELSENDKFNLDSFYDQFPLVLKEKLKYRVYSNMLEQFSIFHKLKPEQINTIGDSLQNETFEKGKIWLTK